VKNIQHKLSHTCVGYYMISVTTVKTPLVERLNFSDMTLLL